MSRFTTIFVLIGLSATFALGSRTSQTMKEMKEGIRAIFQDGARTSQTMKEMKEGIAAIFQDGSIDLDAGQLSNDMDAMRLNIEVGKLIDEEDMMGDLGGDKPKYEVAGSNVENIGSEADRAHRKECAQAEPAWQGVGLAPGVKVWRIEKFQVIDWDEAKYGSFHEGDSYIVLHTRADKTQPSKMLHNIHFWIGNETTNDEQGTAAYKTVELDDFFDGEPIQFREEMKKESGKFKELFEGAVKYLPGGIDSGFKKATKRVYPHKIFQIRKVQKKYMVVNMPWDVFYFNNADSYVVDARNSIYVVHGFRASAFEKYRAASISNDIDYKRSGIDDAAFQIGEDGDFCSVLKTAEPPLKGC